MWREQLGWITVRILLPWLPAAVLIAALAATGALPALAAALIALGLLVLIAAVALSAERWLAGAARAATAALGPLPAVSSRPRRLGPAARALWPALLRLDRDWRRHAGRAETQLAGAEAALAAVPDPLILIDRNRRIVRANAAWSAFIGAIAEPRDLTAALRNPALLAAADAVLAGEDLRTVEFAVSVPVARLLQARLARIDGPSLDGAAAIITLHDITALKRTEEMRADFVANAGHELKTPLSTLLGFIETLRGPAREDAAARERFLGIMQVQATRMARLIDDLLSLSRIELNAHLRPDKEVDLVAIVRQVTDSLQTLARDREVEVVTGAPSSPLMVLGDRDELIRVFRTEALPGLVDQPPAGLIHRVLRPRGGNNRALPHGFGEAIDQALWDLAAQQAGLPLWRYLGGIGPSVRAYASG
ncbi:MAG: hypothetical protein JO162_16050, partial [Alphaproteobacteria bacterium]|nr:hypothetical protein [Alphaproteobacteria bacterium]